jgi:hypothetical protein
VIFDVGYIDGAAIIPISYSDSDGIIKTRSQNK